MLDKEVRTRLPSYEWNKSSQAVINKLTEQDIKEWSRAAL